MSNKVKERAQRLLDALGKRKEDRGCMADLKRGFSETTADRSWPYIARWGCNLRDDRERIVYQITTAAYAYSKGTAGGRNMGMLCRQLAMGSAGVDGLATFEARFRRLLACSSLVELSHHLAGIVRAATAKGIPINFLQLFEDLWWWSYSNEVKINWASEFWGE